jgi:hypothetical protein
MTPFEGGSAAPSDDANFVRRRRICSEQRATEGTFHLIFDFRISNFDLEIEPRMTRIPRMGNLTGGNRGNGEEGLEPLLSLLPPV